MSRSTASRNVVLSRERFEVDGLVVEVERKRTRNLYLRIASDGRLRVSAPQRASRALVERFVRQRRPWVDAQLARKEAHPEPLLRSCVTGETIQLWGEALPLVVDTCPGGSRSRMSLEVVDGTARMFVPAGSSPERRRAWLREWYRARLVEQAGLLVPVWEGRSGLVCSEWRTKWMTSRWGTCNIRARRVWLNVQLAKYPPRCLEYVIVHELAHLEEPGHGPAFRAVMDRLLPDWHETRQLLRDFPITYTE